MNEFKEGDVVEMKSDVRKNGMYNGMKLIKGIIFKGQVKISNVDNCAENTCLLENGYYYGFDSLIKIEAK